MNKNIFIQVYIATHNRSDYLMESVNSVLDQDYNFFEVIVSDNSTNDETERLFSKVKHPRLIYKRRVTCTASEHFNLIIKEVTASYFMMFHDDDVMRRNMLRTYSKYIKKYRMEKPLAIGANAFLLKQKKNTKQEFTRGLKEEVLITNQNHLAELYLKTYKSIPFPSYIYSKEIRENKIIFKGNLCGKYADVALMLDITSKGSILNVPEVLMYYRVHDRNDSKRNDFIKRSRLIKYMVDITTFNSRDPLIVRYRLLNVYNELITQYYRQDHIKHIPLKKMKRMVNLFLHYGGYDFILKIILLYTYHILGFKR